MLELIKFMKDVEEDQYVTTMMQKLPLSEMVPVVYNKLKGDDVFPCTTGKSLVQARQCRNYGHENFNRKKYTECLKYYIQSLAFYPADHEEVAIVYYKRSETLFKLNRYASCLVDVNRALQKPCNDSIKIQLENLKSECKSKLNLQNDFETKLKINQQESSSENKETADSSSELDENATELQFNEKYSLRKGHFKNKEIMNASEKIYLRYTENNGRHLIAKNDIYPGEILATEKAFISHLEFEFCFTHCSNCFIRTESLIPCNGCSTAMYCGDSCRNEAFSLYHRIECEILNWMLFLNIPHNFYMPFRLLMIVTKQGEDIENLMTHPVYGKPFSKEDISDKKYDWNDYSNVHNLQCDGDKLDSAILRMVIKHVTLVLYALRQTSYFDKIDTSEVNLSKSVAFVGSVLLKYFISLRCSTYSIMEHVERVNPENNKRTIEYVHIGKGWAPIVCFVRHSCDPNTAWYWFKDKLTLFSIQPIQHGKRIYISYGPTYRMGKLQLRQKVLKEEFFLECKCVACRNDWPVYLKAPSLTINHLFNKSDKKKINRCLKIIENKDKPSPELFKILCKYLFVLHVSCKRPFKEYIDCQILIEDLLLTQGNYYNSEHDLIL